MGSLAHTRSYGLLIPSDSTSYNFRRTFCTFHVKGCWPTYFSTWMSRSYHDEMELFRIPELALHILGQCETYPQLIALASTCTHLNSIWQRNKAYLIWAIGLQSRPAFNDALMAVRATAIVRNAVLSGVLPPDPFPLAQLSGLSVAPTSSEMDEVFLLEHLVQCLEQMIIHKRGGRPERITLDSTFRRPPDGTPELRQWQTGLYRAFYRSFLAGAVLYRAYNEPFRMAKEKRPEGILKGFSTWYQQKLDNTRGGLPDDWSTDITIEDIDFLSKFAMYDLNLSKEKREATLGPLAEWFIKDTKARVQAGSVDCPVYPYEFAKTLDHTKNFEDHEVAALWEILQFIAACERVRFKLANVNNRFGFGRFRMFALPQPPSGIKKVQVIVFGIFRLEVISTPVLVHESVDELKLLTVDSLIPSNNPSDDIDIRCLAESLYRSAVDDFGMMVASDTWSESFRPGFRLWAFALRKHFGLQLQGHDWDYDGACESLVWSEATFSSRKLLPGSERGFHPPPFELLEVHQSST